MRAPTVHTNGTSEPMLLDQIAAAMEAARALRHALYDMAPHARDYYPQGDDAFHEAQSEHEARLTALRLIQDDLYKIAEKIIDPNLA